MRILYIHQYYKSPLEGGGTRSWEFARVWAREGHEVTIVTSDQQSTYKGWRVDLEDHLEVHRISVPYSQHMGAVARMFSWIRFAFSASIRARRLSPEVVFATSTPLTIIIPALFAKFRRSTTIVFEVRDLWPDVPIAMGRLRNPIVRITAQWLEGVAYRKSARIVAISPQMKKSIESKGITEKKVVSVPQGCDTQIFLNAHAKQIRQNHPWVNDGFVAVYAGTLGKVHGVDYLLDLAKWSLELHLPTRFVCIGDGSEATRLIERATHEGTLGTNLHFAGHLPKPEVAKWYSVASVSLVLIDGPAVLWRDAAQNKFWDSLAAGIPVAFNRPSWQETFSLQHGVGFRLEQDPQISASQLYQAMLDTDWLREAKITCNQLALGKYNRERMALRALNAIAEASAIDRA